MFKDTISKQSYGPLLISSPTACLTLFLLWRINMEVGVQLHHTHTHTHNLEHLSLSLPLLLHKFTKLCYVIYFSTITLRTLEVNLSPWRYIQKFHIHKQQHKLLFFLNWCYYQDIHIKRLTDQQIMRLWEKWTDGMQLIFYRHYMKQTTIYQVKKNQQLLQNFSWFDLYLLEDKHSWSDRHI